MEDMLFCKTKYVDEHVVLSHDWYSNNGRLCIRLLHPEYFDCVAKVTTNAPQVDLREDEIIITDYSENEGMSSWMISQEFVKPNFRIVSVSDWAVGLIFKVTDKLKEALSIEGTVDITKIIEE